MPKTFRLALLSGLAFAATLHAAPSIEVIKPADSYSLPVSSSPAALNLNECFELAVRSNELVEIQAENIEQVVARYKQALSTILPNIRFNYNSIYQDTSGVKSPGGGSGSNNNTRKRREEARFTATQPLFAGLKEFYALRGLKSEERREKLLFNRAVLELFQDVAVSFYNVLQLETELANLRTLSDLTGNRIKELRDRVNLGKSRESETLTVESQAAILRSREQDLIGEIASARVVLSFIVGHDLNQTSLIDQIGPVDSYPGRDYVLEKAVNRSDVLAFWEEVEAQQSGIKVAQSYYYPNVDVTGNYYTKRNGNLEPIDWDVALNVDVPIYQGGGVRGMTREAKSRLRQAEQQYQYQVRLARAEISQAYNLLESSVIEAKLLKDAYAKVKRSYELQVREYRLGLVNNLDVLQIMNTMLETKQNYDLALLQNKIDLLNLWIASENIPQLKKE